jgi:hypothetical protein
VVTAVALAAAAAVGCTDDTTWLESRAGHDPVPPVQVEGAVEEAPASADTTGDVPGQVVEEPPTEAPSAELRTPAAFEDTAAALGSYVDAISSGDVDTALALRCDDAQPAEDELELFALQAGQLVGELAPLEVEFIEPAQSQGVDVARFTLRGHDGWLEVRGTQGPDGGVQLCGFRPTASYLVKGALVPPPDLGAPAATPEALLPTEVIGLEPVEAGQDEQPADPESALSGADERWASVWADATYGGLRVDAARFPDAAQAATAAERVLERRVLDGVSTFDTGVATSTGVRALAMAWLWVQPPTVGPYRDTTVLRFGDTVVVVGASGMDPERQLDLVRSTAGQVIALAQG